MAGLLDVDVLTLLLLDLPVEDTLLLLEEDVLETADAELRDVLDNDELLDVAAPLETADVLPVAETADVADVRDIAAVLGLLPERAPPAPRLLREP